ncbi:MAG TPA: RT0821/Lpp0805 family surface protein [Stellaceae bacterium]
MHRLVSTLALCAALVACAQSGQPSGPGTTGVNETTVGTPVGAAAGGLIGPQLGASLSRADRDALQAATANALENSLPNQVLPWRNADSGNYGTVTPGRMQQLPSGQYCREFQQTIIVGGREQQGHGRACRQPDNSWQMAP